MRTKNLTAREKFIGEPMERTTVLNGFHHVYPSNVLFERYIENGRKECVELYGILPQIPSGGYDALKYTITVKVETVQFDGMRRVKTANQTRKKGRDK